MDKILTLGQSREEESLFIVCQEHLEQAIEEFVELYGASPDIHRLDEVTFTDWKAPETCQYCGEHSVYLVI
jgi:CxxH/CxxC protein (TIGR04129 family)